MDGFALPPPYFFHCFSSHICAMLFLMKGYAHIAVIIIVAVIIVLLVLFALHAGPWSAPATTPTGTPL